MSLGVEGSWSLRWANDQDGVAVAVAAVEEPLSPVVLLLVLLLEDDIMMMRTVLGGKLVRRVNEETSDVSVENVCDNTMYGC